MLIDMNQGGMANALSLFWPQASDFT